MKSCSACLEQKELEEFYSHPKTKDRRQTRCIECSKLFRKQKYIENPYKPRPKKIKVPHGEGRNWEAKKEERKLYQRKYHKKYYEINRDSLLEKARLKKLDKIV